MAMFIFYLVGLVISFALFMYDVLKGGIITVGILKGLCIASLLSWAGVAFYIGSMLDDDKTTWRRKNLKE